jgi:hypothetical protein
MSPYETYNNQIGVRLSFLLEDNNLKHDASLGLIKYATLKKQYQRKPNLKLRAGLGSGNEVLINYQYLPEEWKEQLKNTFGDPKQVANELEKYFVLDGAARLYFDGYTKRDGSHLKPEQISQWTVNASVLAAFARLKQARETMHKRMGNSSRGLWPGLLKDLAGFNEVLKLKFNGIQHTLPQSERRLRPDLKGYADHGYEYFVHANVGSANAAKIADTRQQAILEELLRKHNNFNNVQIATLYNAVAVVQQWKTIEDSTVANYRKQWGFFTHGGQFGETSFDNNRAMQVKRVASLYSTAYWTMDGWDVELLYQKEEVNKNGHKVVTYHNRLTIVVVLDTVAGLKYPVGYAIGTHETPELITEALRNAANHTKELFGQRYKPIQLQSDNYAIKALSPVYEGMSEYFTPARVKNAKAKVIEPYFNHLNKQCQMYFKNWSGHNVTSRKENQPNADYLNKIRHTFPDEMGCRQQIERLMDMERSAKVAEYVERFEAMPVEDRQPLSNYEYLYLFGQTHTHTNKLRGDGLTPTLGGVSFTFDSFDQRFRECAYMDWAVKYDPADMSSILVMNAKSDANSKLKEIVGTHRFELQQKFVQPMALYDRKAGDAEELAKITQFNKSMKDNIMTHSNENQAIVEELFNSNPQLNDTLTKMVLCDSTGQHKDNKSKVRLKKAEVMELPAAEDSSYTIIEDDIRNNY